jgi:hypothetical protein
MDDLDSFLSSLHFWLLFTFFWRLRLRIKFNKNVLGYILCDFIASSSGHPVGKSLFKGRWDDRILLRCAPGFTAFLKESLCTVHLLEESTNKQQPGAEVMIFKYIFLIKHLAKILAFFATNYC